MRALLILTAALTLPALPTLALACQPPPDIWAIGDTWPADGATDVPLDAPILVRGEDVQGGAYDFAGRSTLEVTLDGVPVAGALAPPTFGQDLLWFPDAPFEADRDYTVTVQVTNEDFWGDLLPPPEDTQRTFTFRTGDADAPAALGAEIASVRAEVVARDVVECFDDFVGACFCEDERVTGTQHRLSTTVTLALPDHPLAVIGMVGFRVGPAPDELTPDPRQKRRPLDAPGALGFTYDLGLAGDWTSDRVCVAAVFEDVRGARVDGEPECADIEGWPVAPGEDAGAGDDAGPGDDAGAGDDAGRGDDAGAGNDAGDDAGPQGADAGGTGGDTEAPADDDGGCDASDGAPAALWLLALLPAALRRRRFSAV